VIKSVETKTKTLTPRSSDQDQKFSFNTLHLLQKENWASFIYFVLKSCMKYMKKTINHAQRHEVIAVPTGYVETLTFKPDTAT